MRILNKIMQSENTLNFSEVIGQTIRVFNQVSYRQLFCGWSSKSFIHHSIW